MRLRLMPLLLVMCLCASRASADEVTDHLELALKLHKEGKEIEAKAEIEQALKAVKPLAEAKIPKPTIKDRTYTNYEHGFRVSGPSPDWRVLLARMKGTGDGATDALCQLFYVREGAGRDDLVLFYVRDLKRSLGGRYQQVKGREVEFFKQWGKLKAGVVAKLEDVEFVGQLELKVAGHPAVRTDYRARKGDVPIKCFTVDILRGHQVFSGMFVGTRRNERFVEPAFREILNSIDLSPVTAPAAAPPKGK